MTYFLLSLASALFVITMVMIWRSGPAGLSLLEKSHHQRRSQQSALEKTKPDGAGITITLIIPPPAPPEQKGWLTDPSRPRF